MNKELIQSLTERVALLSLQNSAWNTDEIGEADEVFYVLEAPMEETSEQSDSDEEFDSTLVDFDFDNDNQTNFDTYMTLRFYWRDWNALYTEIF